MEGIIVPLDTTNNKQVFFVAKSVVYWEWGPLETQVLIFNENYERWKVVWWKRRDNNWKFEGASLFYILSKRYVKKVEGAVKVAKKNIFLIF